MHFLYTDFLTSVCAWAAKAKQDLCYTDLTIVRVISSFSLVVSLFTRNPAIGKRYLSAYSKAGVDLLHSIAYQSVGAVRSEESILVCAQESITSNQIGRKPYENDTVKSIDA